MMKRKITAAVITPLLAALQPQTQQIYNKDGNKLDLYGKPWVVTYGQRPAIAKCRQTYAQIGFKGNAD